MEPVKRGIKYLLYHRWKTLLIFCIYSVLFSILLIMVVMNLSSGRFIEDTQKAIGNAVYIRKVRDEGYGRRNNLGIFSDAEIEMLTQDKDVDFYNVLVRQYGNVVDGEVYIKEKERYKKKQELHPDIFEDSDNCTFIGVSNSRYAPFFAGAGFRLKEGTGITEEDEGEPVALVSETLAALNGWKVGDTVKLGTTKCLGMLKSIEFDVRIKGIYGAPKESFVNQTGYYTPDELQENYIFLPWDTPYKLDPVSYQPVMAFVYLKSSDAIPGFIGRMKEEFGEESPDLTQSGWMDKYEYSWDEEWNELVSGPMREIHNVADAAMWIVLAGVVLSVFLISLSELQGRNKEMGIWLACGERRSKIMGQILTERMVPILAALIIAVSAGFATAGAVSAGVVGNSSAQINRQLKKDRENVDFWEYIYSMEEELRQGYYDFYNLENTVDTYGSRYEILFAAAGWYLALAVVLGFQTCVFLNKRPAVLLGREE